MALISPRPSTIVIPAQRGPRVETRGPLKSHRLLPDLLEPEVRTVDRTVVQCHY